MEDLDKICAHKICAEDQRKNELELYGHDKFCEGYKKNGCYDCPGYNLECNQYIPNAHGLKQSLKKQIRDNLSPEESLLKELQESQ